MTTGSKAPSCAYRDVLRAYLESERGRDTPALIRHRMELLPVTPLWLERPTVDLIHDLRVQLEALASMRRRVEPVAYTLTLRYVRPSAMRALSVFFVASVVDAG